MAAASTMLSVLVPLATQAVPAKSSAQPTPLDPLLASVRKWGLPGSVVIVLGWGAWQLLPHIDKLEKIAGWLGVGKKSKQVDPEARPLISTENQSGGINVGTNTGSINLQLPPPQPVADPKLPAGRVNNTLPASLDQIEARFVGREDKLAMLLEGLSKPGARWVVSGMPGVGKSELALQFACRHMEAFGGGLLWIDASGSIEGTAAELVRQVKLWYPEMKLPVDAPLLDRLHAAWREWPSLVEGSSGPPEEVPPVLLIVDDLDRDHGAQAEAALVGNSLPGRFRRLVTQRERPGAEVKGINLEELDELEATRLLCFYAGDSGTRRIENDAASTASLLTAVERLPLALVLLGSWLNQVPHLSVAKLLEELRNDGLAAEAIAERYAPLRSIPGVKATLLLSWNRLSPGAQSLALVLSLTLPEPIPWPLMQRCEQSGERLDGEGRWNSALAELLGANLLRQEGGEGRYWLHPLVRQFLRIQRQGWPDEPRWRQRLAQEARQLALEGQMVDVSQAAGYYRQALEAVPDDLDATLQLGYAWIALGSLKEAAETFGGLRTRARALHEPSFEAWGQNGQGDVLVAQGDGPAALRAYQEGLAIAEALAKRDPANTAWQRDLSVSHDRIGDVLVAQGDGPAALRAYQEGLAIAEALAKRDPANTAWQVDVAVSCSKLGSLDSLLPAKDRKDYLLRGQQILLTLKEAGRLHANQDWIGWFNQAIDNLG
jgi:predicted negative regulator of RcsB-dependent stress response